MERSAFCPSIISTGARLSPGLWLAPTAESCGSPETRARWPRLSSRRSAGSWFLRRARGSEPMASSPAGTNQGSWRAEWLSCDLALALQRWPRPFFSPRSRAGSGEISFCNEFPHKLYIAIAYLQTDVNNYLSRGWLEVETGKCYVFDTAIRVESFYFRAESETYRDGKHKVKTEWGTDKKFAVRDAKLQSYNAEKAYSGMRLRHRRRIERRAAHGHRHLHRDGRIDHHHTGAREERGRGRRGRATGGATGDAE